MSYNYIVSNPRNYLPKPRETSPDLPFLEPSGTPQMYKMLNAANENTARLLRQNAQMAARISRLERSGSIDDTQVMTTFPFQIYQIQNSGTPTDQTLSNLTLQIRGGLVGFRSNYGKVNFNLYQGNYELPLYAVGTDDLPGNGSYGLNGGVANNNYEMPQSANSGGSVMLDAGGLDTLICDNSQTSTHPSGVQIVVPSSISATDISVCFWIKIVDDPSIGPYTQLWGKAVGTGGFGASNPPFQQSNTSKQNLFQTFAVGTVYYQSASYPPVVTQALTGHLLNRYLEYCPNPTLPVASSGLNPKFQLVPQTNRGYWVANGLSAISGGVACYPGDVVVDDTPNGAVYPFEISTGSGTAVLCYYSFIYINDAPNLETEQPNYPGGNPKWQIFGLVYASSVGPPP